MKHLDYFVDRENMYLNREQALCDWGKAVAESLYLATKDSDYYSNRKKFLLRETK